jgi:hypothetical protein
LQQPSDYGQGLSFLKKCLVTEPKLNGVGQRDGEGLQPCYKPLRPLELSGIQPLEQIVQGCATRCLAFGELWAVVPSKLAMAYRLLAPESMATEVRVSMACKG